MVRLAGSSKKWLLVETLRRMWQIQEIVCWRGQGAAAPACVLCSTSSSRLAASCQCSAWLLLDYMNLAWPPP